MSEYDIAIKIAGQLEGSFRQAIKGAQQGLTGLGISGKVGGLAMKGVGAAAKATAAGLAAAGTAIAGVGTYSANVGKDFESAMSAAAATSGATAAEYKQLEAAALEMGRTTSKTAAESANALEYMALAGWNTETSVKALPSVLKMSEASGMDLARTSDLVTDSMAALGVSVDELPGYLDVAAKAQNSSNQSAEQLMEAYLNVGGTMKDLGVPIEESAAALGVLANRGRKGGEAGQALSAIMANLTTGTGQAGKMMDKLGISAFDSEGNFIGLKNTIEVVNEATKNLSDEERNAALAALGGKQHVKDLNKLLGGLNDTTADGKQEWAALTKELKNADDALSQMRDKKMDNLEGDLATLKSAMEDFGIAIYQTENGPLRSLAQYGTEAIYQLSDAIRSGGFEGLSTEIGNVAAQGIADLAAAAPEFIDKAAMLVESFVNGLDQNAGKIGESAGKLISALVSAFVRLAPRLAETGIHIISEIGRSLSDNAPMLLSQAAEAVGYLWGAIKDAFGNYMDFLGDDAVAPITRALAGIPAAIGGLSLFDGLGGMISGIISGFGRVGGVVKTLTRNVSTLTGAFSKIGGLKGIFAALTSPAGIAVAAIALVTGAVVTLWNTNEDFRNQVTQIWNGVQQTFSEASVRILDAINSLGFDFQSIGEVIGNAWTGLCNMFAPVFEGAFATIGQTIQGVFNIVSGIIEAIAGILNGNWAQAWDGAKAVAEGAIQAITAPIKGIETAISSATGITREDVANAVNGIRDNVTNGFNTMRSGVSSAMDAVRGALQGGWNTAKDAVVSTVGSLVNGAKARYEQLKGAVTSATTAIKSALEGRWKEASTAVTNTAKDLVAKVQNAFNGLKDKLFTIGGDVIQGLINGIKGKVRDVLSAAGDLANGIKNKIAGALKINSPSLVMEEYGAYVDAGLAEGMMNDAPAVAEAAGGVTSSMAEEFGRAVSAAEQSGIDLAKAVADGVRNSEAAAKMSAEKMSKTILSEAKTRAKILKSQGDMTLEQEKAYWGEIANSVQAGSAEYATAIENMKKADEGLAKENGKLAESIANNMNVFESFDKKTELSAGQMIKNMQSQVSGVREWANNIRTLAKRGIDEGLLQELSEMGPDGYEKVNAFTQMTDKQLKQANALYAQSLALPQEAAAQIAQSYGAAGTMAAQEFTSGVGAIGATQAASASAKEDMAGANMAVQSGGTQAAASASQAAGEIKGAFDSVDMVSSGANMIQGLIDGMMQKKDQALAAAQEIALATAGSVNNALEVESPSRLLMRTGQYAGEGLAIGMQSQIPEVSRAAGAMAEPIQGMGLGFDMPEPRSGVIGETLDLMSAKQGTVTNNTQNSSPVFNFSPTYTIQGNADEKTVRDAGRMSQRDFERMANEWIRNMGRTAFA